MVRSEDLAASRGSLLSNVHTTYIVSDLVPANGHPLGKLRCFRGKSGEIHDPWGLRSKAF